MEILETVMQALGSGGLQQIGRKLGTDEQTTQRATQAGLGTLLGALSRNASRPGIRRRR